MDRKERDILLIRAFKKGDTGAFEILFKLYHKRLYAFLFSLLKSKDDAEEIVQDTFVKIWEKREEFIEDYPFDSYLFKIAKNAFLNHLRKKINRKAFEERVGFWFDFSVNNTEEYILFRETQEAIDWVINTLPPKRKQIFMMRRIEGKSRQEIADTLSLSVVTVDSQLMKAGKQISTGLQKYNVLFFFVALLLGMC